MKKYDKNKKIKPKKSFLKETFKDFFKGDNIVNILAVYRIIITLTSMYVYFFKIQPEKRNRRTFLLAIAWPEIFIVSNWYCSLANVECEDDSSSDLPKIE